MMSDPFVEAPLAELRREHAEVIRPFLDRLDEIADRLGAGTRVAPATVDEAVRLWERYVHGVHRSRLEALRSPKSLSCGPGLDELLENHERSTQRLAILMGHLGRYRAHSEHGAAALAAAIRTGTFVDREWMRFEETHPIACLAREIPHGEWAAVERDYDGSEPEARRLEGEIREFLKRPVESEPDALELRCAVPTCPSRALVAFRGGADGELHLGGMPSGWSVRPRDRSAPGRDAGSVLALYCPAHAAAATA